MEMNRKLTESGDRRSLRASLAEGFPEIRERDAAVMKRWLGWEGRPETLEEIGLSLGITRERARQLRNRARNELRDWFDWEGLLVSKLQLLLSESAHPLFLDTIAADDGWFDGFHHDLGLLGRILTWVSDDYSVWSWEGRLLVAQFTEDRWREIVNETTLQLKSYAGQGVTRQGCAALISAFAASEDRSWTQLLEKEVSPRLIFKPQNGREVLAAVGESFTSEVRAVLQAASRPLHLEEFRKRLGNIHPNEKSDNVLRSTIRNCGGEMFGRSTYGLRQHLPLARDEEDEIAAEAIAIVGSGPADRQWHAAELAAAISQRRPDLAEDIDKYSLSLVLKSAASFQYLGYFIWALRRSEQGSAQQDRLEISESVCSILESAGGPLSTGEIVRRLRSIRGLNDIVLLSPTHSYARVAKGKWGLVDRDFPFLAEERSGLLDAL
jgi:hypothetical protein